jgi:chromosome segregation ATPase
MALTSTEIKRLLQPMKDFAPAILRCAEIVEAAEEAERKIAGHHENCCTIETNLSALAEQHGTAQEEMAKVQQQVTERKREAQAEIDTLNISVQIVKDQLSAAQRDFETAQREQQAKLDALTLDTQVKEDQLKERTNALASFMAQFPAVK